MELIEYIERRQRERLQARGWDRVWAHGTRRWKRPEDGAVLSEEEAFLWLEEVERNEADAAH